MAMEEDPDKINDADRQLEAKVVASGKKYQASRERSREENALKAKGRKEIEELGFRTDAYQSALRVARDLTLKEQKEYIRDLRFFLKVFGENQADLWPEDAAKAAARSQKRAERKAKVLAAKSGESPEAQERRLAADSPRSNPKSGGANGRARAKDAPAKPSKRAPAASVDVGDGLAPPNQTLAQTVKDGDAAIADSLKSITEREQVEGAALLDKAIDGMKGA